VLEGGIRVPAIIRWPDSLPGGRKLHEMAHFTDWMPTLLSAAGIQERPELPLDGTDLLPVLRGEGSTAGTPRKLFWQHNRNEPVRNCNAAMRDGQWKLVWPYPKEARYKSDEDTWWYQRLYRQPHFIQEIEQEMLEQNVPPPEIPQLFNIEEDPQEKEDLAAQYPDRFTKMKAELETWFDSVEADRKQAGL